MNKLYQCYSHPASRPASALKHHTPHPESPNRRVTKLLSPGLVRTMLRCSSRRQNCMNKLYQCYSHPASRPASALKHHTPHPESPNRRVTKRLSPGLVRTMLRCSSRRLLAWSDQGIQTLVNFVVRYGLWALTNLPRD